MFGGELKENWISKQWRAWLWKKLHEIKFNSDDYLPLNKPLIFHMATIAIRSVFEEDGKLYPQVFLDDVLSELSI